MEIGISKFKLYVIIARVNKTMNVTKAAFSKSVICNYKGILDKQSLFICFSTSVGRNSTRQPILLLLGGGLNRIDCQLVELIF